MSQSDQLARRDFLVRSAKAGAAIVAAGGLGLWLHDRKGPSGNVVGELASLPDFSLPSSTAPKMSIVTGADRVKTVNRALAALGGIERFIKSGDRVVLKVNAAFASARPRCRATSNPDLVAEVARLCLRAGAASVIVTDNPINDPQSCFALTGIAKAAEAAGAKIALPMASAFKPTTLAGATLIKDWPLLIEPFQRRDQTHWPRAGQGSQSRRRVHDDEKLVWIARRPAECFSSGHPHHHF